MRTLLFNAKHPRLSRPIAPDLSSAELPSSRVRLHLSLDGPQSKFCRGQRPLVNRGSGVVIVSLLLLDIILVLVFVFLLVIRLFIDQVGIVMVKPRIRLREWEREFRHTSPSPDRKHHLVTLQISLRAHDKFATG